MRRLCTCIYGGATSLSLSLLVSLSLTSPASAQCPNDAGTGNVAENETCKTDLNDDNINGGCNSFPEVFIDVACSDVICGQASTFHVVLPCTPCTVTADCPDGEVCRVDGICADSCDDSCTVDDDCPTGATCDAGLCSISTCPEGQTCEVDGSCSGGCPNNEACDNDTDGDGEIDACAGPTAPQRRRDTDWFRLTQAELFAGDVDQNNVVQITATLRGEPTDDVGAPPTNNLVTFIIGMGPDAGEQCETATIACTTNLDCPAGETCQASGECTGGGVSTVTFPGTTGYYNGDPATNDPDPLGCGATAQGSLVPAVATLYIPDYPNGIVVFAATGECDGSLIVEGYECADGLNDYNLQIECTDPPPNCTPDNPNLGPCNEANPGVGGCEDIDCCKLVCDPDIGFNALCCLDVPLGWIQQCASAAIDLECAPELGSPVCMSTGTDNSVDGYLRVCADPYGALSSDGFCGTACVGDGTAFSDPDWGDEYNPVGSNAIFECTFTHGFYIFDEPNQLRELLANILQWTNTFLTPDVTLGREIVGLGSTEHDDDPVDGLTDRLTSEFNITGAMSLNYVVDQRVDTLPSGVAILKQEYTVTNNGPSAVSFVMLKALDADLYWPSLNEVNEEINDNVGTLTNTNPGQERHVYSNETGDPGTALTISSTDGTIYYGSKLGVDPDGPGGPDPPMGFGTDSQQWDEYGVATSWENFIPGFGQDADGDSGPTPAGSTPPHDASIGLVIPIDLAAAGPSSTKNFTIHTTYGSTVPLGVGPVCPWDCDGSNDGFSNVLDLLRLLTNEWDIDAPLNCDQGAPTDFCDYDGNGCVDVQDLLKLIAGGHFCLQPDGQCCP